MKKAALLAVVLTMMVTLSVSPAAAQPAPQAVPRIFVRFMPTNMRRLCVGDTLTLNVWTHFEPNPEPQEPLAPLEPLVPGQPPDDEPAAPGLSLSAQLGSLSPAARDLPVVLGDHYYPFVYTAENPGTETVEAVFFGDLASATRTFEVLDHCDYAFKHLGTYHMDHAEADGYITDDAVFTTTGDFTVDRTAGQGAVKLSGSGTRKMIRVIDLFTVGETCADIPRHITGSAPLEIGGTRTLPPDALLRLTLDFAEIVIPVASLEFYCTDENGNEGFGSPLVPHVLDSMIEENMPLTFPVTGGSESEVWTIEEPHVVYTTTIIVKGN